MSSDIDAFPQLVSNFLRAAMIALRSRVFFGKHCADGIYAIR